MNVVQTFIQLALILFGKSLNNFFRLKFNFSRLDLVFFSRSAHLFCYKKGKFHYSSESLKDHEKRDAYLISETEFFIRFSSKIKNLPFGCFLNLGLFLAKKCQL